MVRQLITAPMRLTIAVVGGLAGAVRSRLESDGPDDTVEGVAREVTPERSTQARESVRGRDPAAGHWDEDAPVPPGGSSPDDLVIADRVKSEVFAATDAPKGEINLNVENGVVFLRGHLDDAEQRDELVTLAGAVEGVVRVEDLINS